MALGRVVHNEAAFDMRESNPTTTLCRSKGTRMQISTERRRDQCERKAAGLDIFAVQEIGLGLGLDELRTSRDQWTGWVGGQKMAAQLLFVLTGLADSTQTAKRPTGSTRRRIRLVINGRIDRAGRRCNDQKIMKGHLMSYRENA